MEENRALTVSTETPSRLAIAGQAANQAASAGVFADFRARKAAETLRRHDNDLVVFAQFLQSAGVQVGELARDPDAWTGVTWGLVAAFMRWQLLEGYAVSTANVRLSTVKVYAKLAARAGALEPGEAVLIRSVERYARKEIRHVDDRRREEGLETRKGAKKAQPVSIGKDQACKLKEQPNTPQGRRDGLLMCLMLDHGLRVGEVQILTVGNFDLKRGELRFYRPKVDKDQVHKLTADTLRAAQAYISKDAPAIGSIWLGSRKGGKLTRQGMTTRSITARVKALGRELGLYGLSAHDCRHFWATAAARNKTPIDRLQDAGGWNSPDMPLRYIEAAKVANEGVHLDG